MAQYRTGTVSLINGSPTVTGTGTDWTALDLNGPARLFMVSPAGSLYYVDSVINDNELQLTAPWAGATINDVAYAIHTDFFPNGIPMLNENDVEVVTVYNEAMRILSGNGGTLKVGRNLSDLSNKQVAFNEIRQTATVSSAGVVELATDSEAQSQAGSKVLTPANLSALEATTSRKGLVEKATTSEVVSGTANKYPDAAGLKSVLASFQKNGLKSIDVTGYGTITPTSDDINAGIIVLSGTASLDRTIEWPDSTPGRWLIINKDPSGRALTIKTPSGGGVVFVEQGEHREIYCDGVRMQNNYHWELGEVKYFDTELGMALPDNSSDQKFVVLSEGMAGPGQYNEGLVSNEVSQIVIAANGHDYLAKTGELQVGPFAGRTIRYINSEGSPIFPGETSGQVVADQTQRITGTFDVDSRTNNNTMVRNDSGGFSIVRPGGYYDGARGAGNAGRLSRVQFDSLNSPGARTSETTYGTTEVKHNKQLGVRRVA